MDPTEKPTIAQPTPSIRSEPNTLVHEDEDQDVDIQAAERVFADLRRHLSNISYVT